MVSFFVQAYNTGPYVGECLEGIFAQQGGYDFEVLLIDDASTDNTEQVVRSFQDPRLRYIRHARNQGAIATANEGFAEAKGRFLARIDSDDRYRPTFLKSSLPIFERHPEVGLVYGDIALVDTQGKVTSPGLNVRRAGQAERGNELFALLAENYIPAPTTIIRREALNAILPVPSDLHFLDWYITTSLAEGWDFCFINQVLADYRIHTTNMHRSMIRDKKGEQTIFLILDRIFQNPNRQEEKRLHRKRIYAANYLVNADKYFGHNMNADARRCYWKAIRLQPHWLLRAGILRRFLATCFGRERYERLKRMVKGGRPNAQIERASSRPET